MKKHIIIEYENEEDINDILQALNEKIENNKKIGFQKATGKIKVVIE